MALINWSNDLSVTIDTIDMQHKKLVDLINSLHDAMREGRSKEVISGVLKSLRDYTKQHFADEERRMTAAKYPGFLEHKMQHDRFVEQVNDCIAKHESGAMSVSLSLMNFLIDWLRGHIKGTDKKYVPYLSAS